MKLILRTTAFILALAAVLTGCGLNKPPESTIRYDLGGAPVILDPQYLTLQSETEVIANCFEGLTAISPAGEPVAACAESWSVSQNGKEYTFKLREDLKWSNGDPVAADDFVYGLKRLFNAAAFSPSAGNYIMIENASKILEQQLTADSLGVFAKSDRELVIKLEYAAPSLLTVLSYAAASPCQREFFEEQKGRYGLEAKNLLCNGPFMVESWSSEYIILKRNPQYREKVAISGVNMYINREDGLKRFTEGVTDVFLVPFYRMNEVGELPGESVYDQSWVMIFNYKNKALSSREVRAALTASLGDVGESVALPQYLKPYEGVIAPNAMIGGASYREIVGMPQSAELPQEVRSSFLSALDGMQLNDIGKTTLLVGSFEPGPQMGGNFQRVWQQRLSSFINMEQLEYSVLVRRVANGDFDIAIAPLISQSASPIDSLALFEKLGGEYGQTVSQLLTSARIQDETEKSADLLAEAEQYLIDECIVVPIFSAPSLFVMGDGISGVYYNSVSQTVLFADAVCVRK